MRMPAGRFRVCISQARYPVLHSAPGPARQTVPTCARRSLLSVRRACPCLSLLYATRRVYGLKEARSKPADPLRRPAPPKPGVPASLIRRAAIIILWLAVGLLAVWASRKPLAGAGLRAWCAHQELACSGHITRLGPGGLTLEDVRIGSGSTSEAQADEIRLGLAWRAPLAPRLNSVSIRGLELRGRLDPSGPDFDGIEAVASRRSGDLGAPVHVDIRDASLVLETPFGPVSSRIDLEGNLPSKARLAVEAAPAVLSFGTARLSLRQARLRAQMGPSSFSGEMVIDIPGLAAGDMAMDGLTLEAKADFPSGSTQHGQLEWSGKVDRIEADSLRIDGLTSQGKASLRAPAGTDPEALIRFVETGFAEAGFDQGAFGLLRTGRSNFRVELASPAGLPQGPVSVSILEPSSPYGMAADAGFSGMTRFSPGQGWGLEGDVLIRSASVIPAFPDPAEVGAGADLTGHGRAIYTALREAARAFDAGFPVRLDPSSGALMINSEGALTLQSGDGLRLSIAGEPGSPWLSAGAGEARFSGTAHLSAPGIPGLSARIGTALLTPGRLRLEDGRMEMVPFDLSGRRLGLVLSGVGLSVDASGLSAEGQADVSYSGPIGPISVDGAGVRARLRLERNETGWSLNSAGNQCVTVIPGDLRFDRVGAAGADLQICLRDGWIAGSGGDRRAEASVGRIDLPVRFDRGSGQIVLSGMRLSWLPGRSGSVALSAEEMEGRFVLPDGGIDLMVRMPRADLSARAAGHEAALIEASGIRLGGSLLPADLSAAGIRLAWPHSDPSAAGAEGLVEITGLRLQARGADPVFEPVRGQLSGRLRAGMLSLAGRLASESAPQARAELLMDLDLDALDGEARIVSAPLLFSRRGLQPEDISERFRGLFTDATGLARVEADLLIHAGKVRTAGRLFLDGFGFQTTRFGRVEGVSGEIGFSDLGGLVTDPGQELTIGSVRPGIPLENGSVRFQLAGAGRIMLEKLRFPFAGGALIMSAFTWAPGDSMGQVDVIAEQIDLARLAGMLELEDLVAEGTISGRLPIVLMQNSLRIENARLMADPGGGRLSYTGRAALSAAREDPSAALAFAALRDFDFSRLELSLTGDLAGIVQAGLSVSGRNRSGLSIEDQEIPAGQGFEFRMRFDLPLARLLGEALRMSDPAALIGISEGLAREEGNKPQ